MIHFRRNRLVCFLFISLMLTAMQILTGCRRQDEYTITENTVEISEFEFLPNSMDIPVGETVVWTNNDIKPHLIMSGTWKSPEMYFRSDTLQPGDSFQIRFDSLGSFRFHCDLHPALYSGVINTVEDTLIRHDFIE